MQTSPVDYVSRVEYDERMYKIDQKFDELTEIMVDGFNRVYERFDLIDVRFEKMDQKFDQFTEIMIKGFDHVYGRFGALEGRFGGIERDLGLIKDHFGITNKH